MSIEKIEQELLEGLGKTSEIDRYFGWEDRYRDNAANPRCDRQLITACSPENIRALLDELSRLREVERRAKEVIRPFAEYMEDGMDLDNNGLPLPDEQGVGWIYLNHGRVRSARDLYRVLSEREGQDG